MNRLLVMLVLCGIFWICCFGACNEDDASTTSTGPDATTDDDDDDDDDNNDNNDDNNNDNDNNDNNDDNDDITPPEPDYDMEFEGFGAGATGGEGGETVTVTSLADDGEGTLRQLLREAAGPTIVQFGVEGTITLESVLDLPSDLTLDARGKDITLTKNGLRIQAQENIIIMNLALIDIDGDIGDGLQILDESHDIIVFHCRFDNEGLMPFIEDHPDEMISIVWGSYNISISWCRFSNHDKTLLFGNGDAPPELDEQIAVTLHHNLFENTGRRHPFLRYGRVDLYNNIVRDWTIYLKWPYGTRSWTDAEILAERNWYEQDNPLYFVGAYFGEGGAIKQVDNVQTQPWIVLLEHRPELVFERPYEAKIDEPTQEWCEMLEQHTGNTMPLPAE